MSDELRESVQKDVHRGYVSISVYPASMAATVIEIHQKVNVNDVFGQVGGVVGFFMGMSILSIFQVSPVFQRICRGRTLTTALYSAPFLLLYLDAALGLLLLSPTSPQEAPQSDHTTSTVTNLCRTMNLSSTHHRRSKLIHKPSAMFSVSSRTLVQLCFRSSAVRKLTTPTVSIDSAKTVVSALDVALGEPKDQKPVSSPKNP